MSDVDKFISRKEAAEYLKERYGFGSPKTFAKWATIGGGPKFRRFSRFTYYTRADLDAWVAENMSAPISSTTEAA